MTEQLHQNRRTHLVIKRWLSLVSCGVVAAAILVAIEPLLHGLTNSLVLHLGSLSPDTLFGIVITLFLASCWSAGNGRWRGFFGICHFFSYPPLSVSFATGLVLFFAWTNSTNEQHHAWDSLDSVLWLLSNVSRILTWSTTCIVLLYAVTKKLHEESESKRKLRGATASPRRHASPAAADFDELRSWLRNDSEITKPEDDWFSRNGIAERISRRLRVSHDPPTIAVVGPLGSGKSSIGRLVACKLRDQHSIRLIQLSVWPFDSPEAAVRGILESILAELEKLTNILPIRGIPEDYIAAIERSGGRFGGLARVLRSSSDPKRILDRVADIAVASGLRVVLWIEDLERFAAGNESEHGQPINREGERLGPIRALLYLLDKCPSFSVIIADTSLRTRFDIEKIARFVEQVPTIDKKEAWHLISLFRRHCLNGYPRQFRKSTSSRLEDKFTRDKHAENYRWIDSVHAFEQKISIAITNVIETPRSLKSILRATLESWESLVGEIEFESVLVASVIRITHPSLFSHIAQHIDYFKEGFTELRIDKNDPQTHRIVAETDALLSTLSDRRANSYRALIKFLFPEYPPKNTNAHNVFVSRPQALFVTGNTNYWQRYLSQDLLGCKFSDQIVLDRIARWRAGKDRSLLDLLVDPQGAGQIQVFVGRFRKNELCRLLEEVCWKLLDRSASNWHRRASAPGVDAIWRMTQYRSPNDDVLFETLKCIIARTVPTHLPLAFDVIYTFAVSRKSIIPDITQEQQESVICDFIEIFAREFTGDDALVRLRNALKDGSPWLIHWISANLPKPGDPIAFFDLVPGFPGTMVRLAECEPTLGVPLIVPLISNGEMAWGYDTIDEEEEGQRSEWIGKCNLERAEQIFGSDLDRLVKVCAGFSPSCDLDAQIGAECRAVVNAARALTLKRSVG